MRWLVVALMLTVGGCADRVQFDNSPANGPVPQKWVLAEHATCMNTCTLGTGVCYPYCSCFSDEIARVYTFGQYKEAATKLDAKQISAGQVPGLVELSNYCVMKATPVPAP